MVVPSFTWPEEVVDGGINSNPVSYTHLDVYKRQEYTFAGWFFTSYDGEYGAGLNWSRSNSVTTQNLFASEQVENHRIYAYWIEADYSKATIGYRTTSTTAPVSYTHLPWKPRTLLWLPTDL